MKSQRERDERELFARATADCTRCKGEGWIDINDNNRALCPACRTPEARQRLIAQRLH